MESGLAQRGSCVVFPRRISLVALLSGQPGRVFGTVTYSAAPLRDARVLLYSTTASEVHWRTTAQSASTPSRFVPPSWFCYTSSLESPRRVARSRTRLYRSIDHCPCSPRGPRLIPSTGAAARRPLVPNARSCFLWNLQGRNQDRQYARAISLPLKSSVRPTCFPMAVPPRSLSRSPCAVDHPTRVSQCSRLVIKPGPPRSVYLSWHNHRYRHMPPEELYACYSLFAHPALP